MITVRLQVMSCLHSTATCSQINRIDTKRRTTDCCASIYKQRKHAIFFTTKLNTTYIVNLLHARECKLCPKHYLVIEQYKKSQFCELLEKNSSLQIVSTQPEENSRELKITIAGMVSKLFDRNFKYRNN